MYKKRTASGKVKQRISRRKRKNPQISHVSNIAKDHVVNKFKNKVDSKAIFTRDYLK
jgi:hypothetical protein